jgi:hypothetical protein
MQWKECSVMDERFQFAARRLAGEGDDGTLQGVRDFPQDRLPNLRSSPGMWSSKADRQEPMSPIGIPINSLSG